jgi:hypothetical protein
VLTETAEDSEYPWSSRRYKNLFVGPNVLMGTPSVALHRSNTDGPSNARRTDWAPFARTVRQVVQNLPKSVELVRRVSHSQEPPVPQIHPGTGRVPGLLEAPIQAFAISDALAFVGVQSKTKSDGLESALFQRSPDRRQIVNDFQCCTEGTSLAVPPSRMPGRSPRTGGPTSRLTSSPPPKRQGPGHRGGTMNRSRRRSDPTAWGVQVATPALMSCRTTPSLTALPSPDQTMPSSAVPAGDVAMGE